MLGEFLLRLAVALPIVCGLAVASLFAVKRGWVRLPAIFSGGADRELAATGIAAPLSVVAVKSLSPAARVAVVRFAGRDLLIGVSGQGMVLLGEAGSDHSGAHSGDPPGESAKMRATRREIA